MVVRGCEVKDRPLLQLLRHAHDRRAIALAQTIINHQRRAITHHNPDVRPSHNRIDVLGDARQPMLVDQRLPRQCLRHLPLRCLRSGGQGIKRTNPGRPTNKIALPKIAH